MKTLVPILILTMLSTHIHAQVSNGLSLNDAVQKALQQRRNLKVQQVNVAISQNEIRKVNTRKLPQVSTDLDLRYNSRLQSNVIPGEVFGPPGTPAKVVQFGTKYNTIVSFNATQNIFNPTNLGDKDIARAQVSYNEEAVKKTEADIKQEVVTAYFTILLQNEKTALSKNNLERTQKVFATAKSQLQQGSITSYDYQKAEIDYENAFAENEKNTNNTQLYLNDLWFKMGEDSIKNAPLTDSISTIFRLYSQLTPSQDPSKRPELEMEKLQQQIYRMNVRKINLTYLPVLSLYGNYTLLNLNNHAPAQTGTWYPYNYVGVKASLPIFDGLLKERNKAEYKLRTKSSNLNYEYLKKQYNQEAATALAALKNAQADLNYQQKNLALATQLYKIDTDRLNYGTIKPNDLLTTYYTLQQTQNNYLNAIYNYLSAVVGYRKAVGEL